MLGLYLKCAYHASQCSWRSRDMVQRCMMNISAKCTASLYDESMMLQYEWELCDVR